MPLPAPFRKFEKMEALLYRGAVSVLGAPPGGGKTITALNIVHNLKVPTMYVSNDSTRYTIAKRVYALIAGIEQSFASGIIESKPEVAAEAFIQWDNVRFNFNSSPSVEEIALNLEAFREMYGEYPHLTVVDILMNVEHDGVLEQNYWRLFPALKDVAKETNTALLAVHHTSESVKMNPCPPKSSLMGKANQLPELIVTQVLKDDKIFYAIVKNRNGKDDESGETYFTLPVDAARCLIDDEDPDEGLIYRDGPSVPDNLKINAESMKDF